MTWRPASRRSATIARTARAGRDGWAITLAEYNQHTQVRILQRALRLDPLPPVPMFDMHTRRLTPCGRIAASTAFTESDTSVVGAPVPRPPIPRQWMTPSAPVTHAAMSAAATGLPFRTTRRDRKSTRLNSSHMSESRMPSSA